MKIILAYISGQKDRTDPYVTMLPTGLCYLQATLINAGFDSTLVNFSGCTEKQIRKQLSDLKPEMLCLSQWTHNRHATLELAAVARRLFPGCLIVAGGGHATFQYRQLLAEKGLFDAVVIGEGEETVRELAEKRCAGLGIDNVRGIALNSDGAAVTVNPPRPLLAELDKVPFSSLHLAKSLGVDIAIQAEFMVTSRGCPSACRFCSSPVFWNNRVRFRSPANIVDEILFIRKQYGLIYFSFRDDTFTADRNRTIEFCLMLIERKAGIIWNCQSRVSALDEELLVWMKRAGCECVQLGVESGSPVTLARLGKKITPEQVETAAGLIKKVGINLSVYLISDIPGEKDQDQEATVSLMGLIAPDDGYVSPLAYYPGTALFEEAVKEGRVKDDAFVTSPDQAVYALQRSNRQSQRYLKVLTGRKGDPKRFARQKQLLGYCYVTNVIAGETYIQAGDPAAAEREYREIIRQESDNPWGWLLMAELLLESGRGAEAMKNFKKVLEIVPKHTGALEAVREIKKRGRQHPAS